MMPSIRFRDSICHGLSKKDDDNLAKTSPVYQHLALSLAMSNNSCGEDEGSYQQDVQENHAQKR